MARGGRRAGVAGTPYPNRADLRTVTRAPAVAPTGLPYGEHQNLVQSQKVVPVGRPAVPPASPSPTPGTPGPQPGTLPWIAPTARPNEPVTAGIDRGPGPGSEALVGPGAAPAQTLSNLLSTMAASPNAPDSVKALASFTATGKQ